MSTHKRTTIFADDELLKELKELSREEDRSVAEIVREAVGNYIKQKRQRKKPLSIIGIGTSGRTDIAERHEEILMEMFKKWNQ